MPKIVNALGGVMVGQAKQDADQRCKVFVYGTLKRGFANHYFLRNAHFFGMAKTVKMYGLYVDEFPSVYAWDAVSPIRGEVYDIDMLTLRCLDGVEGHPRFSRREEIEVLLDSGQLLWVWFYFYPQRGKRLISNGEFNLSTGLAQEMD
ncbi:gamma-glutamylcyclotransferase family protein [Pseudodesulfovibrio piezophilus]|uniref:Gamma-glutamylcyclotransferase family protein n=1 Tax=Pseudodesulfovibrio piezophilus (strain DSM 21447 / JCM 15486 / C1TLV30) TaxID=1322246 RepID=M1WRJ8_PSEP2|nr:gamma-glutamylcyclotransferase family protein [Pseudodesulfovibrio piezophilus]CCH48337.1 putative enzyme [Pseudodesulfovibrio piezophilus C1TLV30]